MKPTSTEIQLMQQVIDLTTKLEEIQGQSDQPVNEYRQAIAIDPEEMHCPIILISYSVTAPDNVTARVELRIPVGEDGKIATCWQPKERTPVLGSSLYDRAGEISENKKYRRLLKFVDADTWEEAESAADELTTTTFAILEGLQKNYAELQATQPPQKLIVM